MADKKDPKAKRNPRNISSRHLLTIQKMPFRRSGVHGSPTTPTSPGAAAQARSEAQRDHRGRGASGQRAHVDRLRNELKAIAASKQFSTDFEGRVYSILSERSKRPEQSTHTMTSLAAQRARSNMRRADKFSTSIEQRAATKRTGFVHGGGVDI